MKFLYIHSDKISISDIPWGLLEIGEEVDIYSETITLQTYVEEEFDALNRYLREHPCDYVITHNFSRMISDVCNERQIIYISWVFDSPQWDLFHREAQNSCNRIFVFDRAFTALLKQRGLQNVFYMPLAANVTKAEGIQLTREDEERFSHTISFVGGLYSHNFYDTYRTNIPLEAVQKLSRIHENYVGRWGSGISPVGQLDEETFEAIDQSLYLGVEKEDRKFFFDIAFLSQKIARLDRVAVLNRLGSELPVTLYTGDDTAGIKGVELLPSVSQDYEVPRIYHLSKINLNITLRSIETGVPKRVLDIMAVAGFTFSNYQAEMTELFEEDKEIVLFRNPEELMEKAHYYLRHERERVMIAWNGYQRVKQDYTYPVLLKKILQLAK